MALHTTVDIPGLQRAMAECAEIVEEELDRLLPHGEGRERRLYDAMRYSSMGGGKRLRPFLVLSGASLFNVAERSKRRVAAAIEMVHCYSLVHDDLPAMDDDDLRRGQPTCHKKFDEATAILAGDGLLTFAFEVLAGDDTHSDPAVRCQLVKALAVAAGPKGMVGGQMIDLAAEGEALDIGEITRLQRLKTGALISFSCEAGAVLGKASPAAHHALAGYAQDLGLAFQIVDDLLDHEGSEAETGKKVGKDAALGKATFVSILGADRARAQADMLAAQAIKHLDMFDEKADALRAVARFVVQRRS
ncbi:MAG: polyprenyl synthetase family protein [Alphaproteobacteria bacterium]|nr:polyprenyl synthetase family protein [Alphaproteobacteria bacterium]